ETIWYYDLSDVKVGKKTPITQAHFEDFFKLLPARGDSERSWSVPFASLLEKATEEAKPYREQAAGKAAQAKALEEAFRSKRKYKTAKQEDPAGAADAWKALEREARELRAKAQEIEDAVYDLKAVNPNRKSEEDTRTPAELLDFIEARGKEADNALARLRELISQAND
ncbi:MAG: hypothetical protein JWM16_533, partial [Verrucomicrobiales bacterium]|nr:hypothetical protein [Verrucomicrobiales bacterium]